jgi:hypothetical protein
MPEKGWLSPPDCPFTPAQAAACLADLRGLVDAALSGVPVEPAKPGILKKFEETALRENLDAVVANGAEDRAVAARLRLLREQAQKALLWCWLQESQLAEIARHLERQEQEGLALERALDDLPESTEPDVSARNPVTPLTAPLAIDPALLPPWEKCIANACFLLGPDTAVFLDEPARSDALENLSFVPSSAGASLLGTCPPLTLLEASGTPRQLTSPGGAGRGDSPLDVPRVWYTWRAP